MSELFVEIRCEELPPGMVQPALDGLRDGLKGLLVGLEHGAVRVFATPRRLAVAIADVPDARPFVERLLTGPPAERSFQDGVPTQAALGFLKGKGVPVEAIEIIDGPKGKVIAVRVKEGGEQTRALLEKGLEGVIRAVPFAKSMEWGSGGIRFGRPIQGIAALFGGTVVAGNIAGLAITGSTVAHRLAPDNAFSFTTADEWLAGLRSRWVEPDLAVRRATIRRQLDEVAAAEGADRIGEDDLLDQIVHLVEAPLPVVCEFEGDLLELPPRLLVQSMKVHQRYFPLHRSGKLTNRFVAIANNPEGDPSIMAAGFARVLRARFHDAKFFFASDKKKPLDVHGDGLARMRWIKGLGTMAQKQARMAAIAVDVVDQVGADASVVARAASLAKCDLLTAMVGEFPELQGHMGRLYATAQGESEAVAVAIEEAYLPRFAGDGVARSPAGVALAISERVDTLVGCFGVGMAPKGGGDPQGLRRAALGLVNTLIEREIAVDLRTVFAAAVRRFHDAVRAEPDGFQGWAKERGSGPEAKGADALVDALVEFAIARWKAAAIADGTSGDLVDAVLIGGETRPVVLHRKLAALKGIAGTADFLPIMNTFKRVLNISRDADVRGAGPLTEPAEHVLADALARVEGIVVAAADRGDYAAALEQMLSLKEPVARFFDEVLVDSPEPAVRAARMGLLKRISTTFLTVADFSRISTR